MAQAAWDEQRISFSIRRIPVPLHPGTRVLLDYYQSLKRDGSKALPRRQDIEPWELGPLLPYVFFVLPDGESDVKSDYRYSLVGTGLTRRFNLDSTGRRISEIYDRPALLQTRGLYDRVTQRRVTAVTDGHFSWFGVEHMSFEAVHLPILTRDGRRVQIFGGLFFHDQPIFKKRSNVHPLYRDAALAVS